MSWIKISERARAGINIMNSLTFETFSTVLNFVHRQMTRYTTHASVGSHDPLESLEKLVGVPRADFLLLIKTFSYILKRISTFVLKPTRLQAELREKLQFQDEAKIDVIVRLWARQTIYIMRNLAHESYEAKGLYDIAWKLNLEISSQCRQRKKVSNVMLELKTYAGHNINLEMNTGELLKLFNQCELIQYELDTIHNNKL